MASVNMTLSWREKSILRIQNWIGWLSFPIWGSAVIAVMRWQFGYRVDNLMEVRKRFEQITQSATGPVLLCVNHLTKFDSVILNWSLASVWSYFVDFDKFSWNMPERKRYRGHPLYHPLCYLGQCFPIERGGSRDSVKKSMDKVKYLLGKGHIVTLFPEGRRSETGRIDTEGYSYGAGRLISQLENCTAVCVYLRGHNQTGSSSFPPRGARFQVKLDAFQPTSVHKGLRASRDIATQVIEKMNQMETAYFAACG
jgi:1-acyl-sn-glycerol-3-phosphate acyltransferase